MELRSQRTAGCAPAAGLTAAALATVGALFALGGALIAALGRGRSDSAELWRYFRSEFVIVGAVLIPAAVHRGLFAAVVAAGAARCTWEVLSAYRATPRAVGGLPFAIALPLLGAGSLALLAWRDDALAWIFLLFAVVETQDAMAWLFGRLLGRRPFLRILSPRKTLEGALAGFVSGVAVGVAVAGAGMGLSWSMALAASVLIAVAGFAGDLIASFVKRRLGTKDFPPVHPLHGGLLDVYDSLLFAAIALHAALWLMGAPVA